MRKSLPILALLVPAAASAQSYHIIDLGTLGGASSIGRAVNDLGQVTGDAATTVNTNHAFLYTPGTGMKDLGTAGGFQSHGYGINASGQVAGTIDTRSDNPAYARAFLSAANGGALKDLGVLGGLASYGYAVNASGQVAGGVTSVIGQLMFTHHAVRSAADGGALQDLTPSAGNAITYIGSAVNDRGQVAGTVTTDHPSAFLIGGKSPGILNGLGKLVSPYSHGLGVNASGQVTGDFTLPDSATGEVHAYLSDATSGVMTDLGTLGGRKSVGYAVNDRGQVVGSATTAITSSATHAFLYTATAGMRDLNRLLDASGAGWTLTTAYGLSNTGYITGVGTFNGQSRAFLLTQAVPEPAPLAALGLGALALLRRRRARR